MDAVRPADITGSTAAKSASGAASRESQANGSLMRISPLAIWGCSSPPDRLAELARADSGLTHPHQVCRDAAAAFTVAAAHAIRTGEPADRVYDFALRWANAAGCDDRVQAALRDAASEPPRDFLSHQGWVLVAFQNAFHQLLYAPSLDEGVVRTVMSGGDTDTNAAIAGALLGSVHGRAAVPADWRQMILTCRPLKDLPGVHQPRPRAFWPVDVLELAERLVVLGSRRV